MYSLNNIPQYFGKMEKHSWCKLTYSKNTPEPPARWGHCAVKVEQQIFLFGGYAESLYMNDMWCFNTKQMTWKECMTYGAVPSPRSNSTIHYDQAHRCVILFGGGGPHKQRFNDVHILDWNTKQWRLVHAAQSEQVPWQRTYHSSELLYPYLMVFGGEAISDLNDLWAFNLQTEHWTELKIGQNKIKPCSRRFHSSVIIENNLYVIGGCHDKYRCLSDIFTIDLSPFVNSHQISELQWEELNLKNNSFLTRWGHTSAVFDHKIYIFGGRFSNDLQDILVLDPVKEKIKTMKVNWEMPKPRRRHSSTFIGSNMVVFGGFNGQYFNDMYYINVFELSSKPEISSQDTNKLQRWVNNKLFSDYSIQSKDKLPFYIHKGLIADRFNNQQQLYQFLTFISNRYTKEELTSILQILYTGIGTFEDVQGLSSFQLFIHDNEALKDAFYLASIGSPQTIKPFENRPKQHFIPRVVSLPEEHYSQQLQNGRTKTYKDKHITFNQEYCLPANSIALAVNSEYFRNLLKQWREGQIKIELQGDVRVFQVLLNYLQTQFVVVPQGIGQDCWIALAQLAQYFCLHKLQSLCEVELINQITQQNCEQLFCFATSNHLKLLQSHSGEYLFRMQWQKALSPTFLDKYPKKLKQYYDIFEFDLQQQRLKGSISETSKPQPISSTFKENYRSRLH